MPHWAAPQDVIVPRVLDGIFQYTMMELVAPSSPGDGFWFLRDKTIRQLSSVPMANSVLTIERFAGPRFEMPAGSIQHQHHSAFMKRLGTEMYSEATGTDLDSHMGRPNGGVVGWDVPPGRY